MKELLKKNPWYLEFVPGHFKTQEMCDDAVMRSLWLLIYVPDLFVTQELLKMWHGDNDYCNDDEVIEWYDGYQKSKA